MKDRRDQKLIEIEETDGDRRQPLETKKTNEPQRKLTSNEKDT
jgi:hypothetical protein